MEVASRDTSYLSIRHIFFNTSFLHFQLRRPIYYRGGEKNGGKETEEKNETLTCGRDGERCGIPCIGQRRL